MFRTYELLKHLTKQSGHTKLTAKMQEARAYGGNNGGIGKHETDKVQITQHLPSVTCDVRVRLGMGFGKKTVLQVKIKFF